MRVVFVIALLTPTAALADDTYTEGKCDVVNETCNGGGPSGTSGGGMTSCPDGQHLTNGACYDNDGGDDDGGTTPSSNPFDAYDRAESIHKSWRPHTESTQRTIYHRRPRPRDERWDDIALDSAAPLPIFSSGDSISDDERVAIQYDANNTRWTQDSEGCVPFFCGNNAADRQMSAWLRGSSECTADNNYCDASPDEEEPPFEAVGGVLNLLTPNPQANASYGVARQFLAKTYNLVSNPGAGPSALLELNRLAVFKIAGGSGTTLVNFTVAPNRWFDWADRGQILYKLGTNQAP